MGIAEIYDFYWNENVDPRTKHIPLVSSPIIIPAILFSYLYFVLKCGPEFMKNRKPYTLLTFVKCYNIFQIVMNLYIIQTLISAGWFTELPFTCILPEYGFSPRELKITFAIYLGLNLKLIDLIETIVFVLRKKNRQISFLHLYHHVSTVMIIWLSTKYISVAMVSFPLLLNSIVHVVMYSYYLFTTFGENMRKTLTNIKPLITIIQMIQFILLILYSVQGLLPSCPVTRVPGIVFVINVAINFVLFYNFYQKNYAKRDQKKS